MSKATIVDYILLTCFYTVMRTCSEKRVRSEGGFIYRLLYAPEIKAEGTLFTHIAFIILKGSIHHKGLISWPLCLEVIFSHTAGGDCTMAARNMLASARQQVYNSNLPAV